MGIQFLKLRPFRDRPESVETAPQETNLLAPVAPLDPPAPCGTGLVAHYIQRSYARAEAGVVSTVDPAVPVVAIGRGTVEHAAAVGQPARSVRPRSRRHRSSDSTSIRQRLVAATFAAALLFAGLSSLVSAEQYRYRVQQGDTLEGVAARFGVDAQAIARSSWFSVPGQLTPGDVIIIPGMDQSPAEAAAMAAERAGTSPWAAGAHWVVEGDDIFSIAAAYGVEPEALIAANGLSWGDYIYPGDRLIIPGGDDGSFSLPSSASTTTETPRVNIWVPEYVQQRNLSCEYAAAYIATSAFGAGVPEWAFMERIPVTLNPHYGYRGDIDGRWGGYDDWGIYAEPLVPVLNDWGYAAEAFYSMGDASQLIAHLDAGHPVVVWLAMWGDTGIRYQDEGTYTVFAGSHVVTAYGYDDAGVYVSDPGTGTYRFFDWSTFLWMWGAIDGMSMAVYPL